MSAPYISIHGDVISSALQANDHTYKKATDSLFEETKVYRGQIQKTYAVDDVDNNEGLVTLFDVLIIRPDGGTEIIRQCRAIQSLFGGTFNNFLEILPTDNGPQSEDMTVSVIDKPGTHVLVAFISGHRAQGVILGALPHPNKLAVDARPTKADAPELQGEFQGLNWLIDSAGALTLTFNGPKDNKGKLLDESIGPTEITIDSAGNFQIDTNEEQIVRIDREAKTIEIDNGAACTILMEQKGNKITLTCDELDIATTGDCNITTKGKTVIKATKDCQISSDSIIRLSKTDGNATEPFVLGNKFVSFIQDLCTAIGAISHIGNLGSALPPPTNAGDFAALSARAQELLSELIMGTK